MKKKTATKRKTPLTRSQMSARDAVPPARKIKIRLIGLGGGGSAIVSEMASVLKGVSFVAADTDFKTSRKLKKGVKFFQFGEKITNGLGTGLNPELAQKAAQEEKEKITRLFKDCDLVILVGSLGGGVASGASSVFAEVAEAQKAIAVGIFTMPFSFEGEKKTRLANKALEILEKKLSGVMVVPNERIFLLVDKKTPLKKSLSLLNQMFALWLNDLLQVIVKPGLINIDFADLKTILEKRGKKLFFGQGTAQGPLRAEEVVKNIFQSPFAQGAPLNVKRILFNITGGKDLGLKEIEIISNNIAALNPKAKIIFGITESPSFQGKVKILLLAVSDDDPVSNAANGGETPASGVKQGSGGKSGPAIKKSSRKSRNSRLAPPEKEERIKIRRNAVEVKKADEEERDREWEREAEWEVPAFLKKDL
ncbi:MAG: cell division protein FtsZ [Candidatus Pacebacteria bacterium]|nr:cell division protein FtsZ [Candidatus Paceibacterota bacterium]